jgi:hypothetical protein
MDALNLELLYSIECALRAEMRGLYPSPIRGGDQPAHANDGSYGNYGSYGTKAFRA